MRLRLTGDGDGWRLAVRLRRRWTGDGRLRLTGDGGRWAVGGGVPAAQETGDGRLGRRWTEFRRPEAGGAVGALGESAPFGDPLESPNRRLLQALENAFRVQSQIEDRDDNEPLRMQSIEDTIRKAV